MPFVYATDGTRLYAKDWGSGPPIVLVHGWPATADMWEYQAVPLVERGFRVITYDRRGFGRSDQPGAGYDYDTLASDLAAVLDELDVRGATLAGFSMGGGEVVRYLARHGSARVSRGILVSSVAPYMLKTDDNPDGVPAEVFDGILDGLRADRPGFLSQFSKNFYNYGVLSHPVSQQILDWTAFMAFQASPLATLACVRAFSATDFRADLPKIQVPLLVLHGDSDAIVPIEVSSARVAKILPGARYKVYEGGSHGMFVTHKDALTEDIASFAASTP